MSSPSQSRAADLTGLAVAFLDRGAMQEAERHLKEALRHAPDHVDALVAMGVVCGMGNRLTEAVKHLRRAVKADPASAAAQYNLGQALISLGKHADAVEALAKAARLEERAATFEKLGDCQRQLGKLGEAAQSYTRAVALDPGNSLALSSLVEAKRKICDWTDLAQHEADLIAAAMAGKRVEPLLFEHVCDDPVLQRRVSETYWREMIAPSSPPALRMRRAEPKKPGAKLRIGYLSVEFRRHPMVSVIAEAIELHDRSRFEVWGYSYGLDDGSPERKRMQNAFDRFQDVRTQSDREIAERIQANGVDILIELSGYTANARLGIVAAKPAPVVCHYMGYPGSLGSPVHDYVIADPVVAPPGSEPFFTEAVARLPGCYWGVDRKRQVGTPLPSRRDVGLPENAVVLASFNGQQKLSPALLDCWARILEAVPGAVLWLFSDTPAATCNLAAEAKSRGLDASRLVMASREPPQRHLARLPLADLLLDAQPYGGHTTTCDALFMGVPVLSLAGRAFASRVGMSLLTAAGLPDLVMQDTAAYEREAVALAADRTRLAALRTRVASARTSSRLFDTAQFTRELESVLETMWDAACWGTKPVSFTVSAA